MLLIGRRSNRGFTLLETMISAVIVSVSLTVILNSFMGSIRAIELSEDYFKAGLLLEEKLYELFNTEVVEGSSEAGFPCFNNAFSWQLGVAELEGEGVRKLDLKVSWRQGTREHNISILTYL